MNKPMLITSLDFELFWGMQDCIALEDYKENIMGGRKAIPRLLKLFEKHGVHCTWATVGFLFADDYSKLKKYFPQDSMKPAYDKEVLSTYRCFGSIGENEEEAPCYYAPSLIEKISKTEGQEIASHTFSHYYCRESGQTVEQFEADMKAAVELAESKGFTLTSLVLPRNQCEEEYTQVFSKLGLKAYRDEENDWIHKKVKINPLMKVLRLMDVYFPLTGQGGYIPKKEYGVWNFTGSRMYKPYFKPLAFLERLKIRRIKKQMLHAAKNNLVFHLWWHPHNIGVKTDFHLKQLDEIFGYYEQLKNEYGMVSMNMREATEYFSTEN